ncbi:SDR family oxidoreductase [Roseivivax sp. GX 12232]|uniref:SDR family NAD(P)-dependent oxidoreductase n=1 Tax=Roseivivax sp. GX 12232 TaxID=2900547 RepID=UPI001E43A442|nr:SDR family oxidoreductase [Roseivivax sp. GX 12232]MCE0505811.1 SDR family oxidoreductase [Roseivivax sp. GX 12232]
MSAPVAVLTGATSGIGRALALEYARRGHRIIGLGRAEARRAELLSELEEIAPGAGHEALGLDVGDADQMGQLAARLTEIGRADLLVCSAVVGRDPEAGAPPRTRDLPLADWQRAIDVNLHGVFLADQAVLPLMRKAGEGDILHIGSSTTPQGLRGTPLAPAYCATKFALAALGRELAEALGPEGIRVRTVFPGSVDTPLIADTLLDGPFGGRMTPEGFARALADLTELGRRMACPDPHLLPMPRRGRQRHKARGSA